MLKWSINRFGCDCGNKKMNTIFKHVLGFSMLALCGYAISQEAPKEASKSIYFGANIGYSKLSDQTGSVNSQLQEAVGGTTQSSQNNNMAAYRLFGGFILNENISIELGLMQTSQESLNYSGTSIGGVNYSGNLNASFSGADLGLVLHPSQSTGFKSLFLDLGFTNYTAKESGNISTNIASYSPSQNESGTGHYYGLGYDLTLHNDYVIRGTINHYDNIGGNTGISGNVGSIGVIKKY